MQERAAAPGLLGRIFGSRTKEVFPSLFIASVTFQRDAAARVAALLGLSHFLRFEPRTRSKLTLRPGLRRFRRVRRGCLRPSSEVIQTLNP